MNFLDSCRHLVGLDSTPSHGNCAAAEYVGQLCEQAGLHVEYQKETLDGIEQCNVIARPQKERPPSEFLLQTHLDTVDAGPFGLWSRTQLNPFNASIYDGVMFGLGTADAKLDFLCKLEAVRPLVTKKLKVPFVLAATFGAQSGMAGAIRLIRKKKIAATRALVGEPTQMKLVTAGSGLAVVEVSVPFSDGERAYRRAHDLQESSSSQSKMFSGKAAHSSAPGLGQNAIMKMLEYLTQLPDGVAVMDLSGGLNYNSVPAQAILEIDTGGGFRDPILPKIAKIYQGLLELEKELHGFPAEGFEPAHATMNIGMIRTDEAEVRLTGSCRLPPSVTDGVYEGWMKKLETAVREVGASFRVKEYRKGFSMEETSDFVQGAQEILAKMSLDSKPQKTALSCEANVFIRLGVECLVWGPGQSVGNSHAPNENVKINDLRQATEFYRSMVERFCL